MNFVRVLSGNADIPDNWDGKVGYLNAQIVQEEVTDAMNCRYYLSGPNAMVNAYKKMLREMGVPSSRIITDYFPGY